MLSATEIGKLGEVIGVEPGIPFSAFRRKAISYSGKNQEAPRNSQVYKNVQHLNIIISKTSNDRNVINQPWETVAYKVLNGDVNTQRNEAKTPPPGTDLNEVLREAQLATSHRELQEKLRFYHTRLTSSKAGFAIRSKLDFEERKKAVLSDLHDYRDAIEKLEIMAGDFIARQTEVQNAKSNDGARLQTLGKLVGEYDVFVKHHAPAIAQHISQLDNNPLVSQLVGHNYYHRFSLIVSATKDETKLKKELENLKAKLGDEIVTGIGSVFNLTKNRMAREGIQTIEALVKSFADYRAVAKQGVYDLDSKFRNNLHSIEAQRAVIDACFGLITPSNAAEKVQAQINDDMGAVRHVRKKKEAATLDGIALLKRHAFRNNYANLPGLTEEQRSIFKDLNSIAVENADGFRATLLCEGSLKPGNIIPAINESALNTAREYCAGFDVSARERIKTMEMHACPYTVFENNNRDLIDKAAQHLATANAQKTQAQVDAYTRQAQTLQQMVERKLEEMGKLENLGVAPQQSTYKRYPVYGQP